jgi:hypothetical protein
VRNRRGLCRLAVQRLSVPVSPRLSPVSCQVSSGSGSGAWTVLCAISHPSVCRVLSPFPALFSVICIIAHPDPVHANCKRAALRWSRRVSRQLGHNGLLQVQGWVHWQRLLPVRIRVLSPGHRVHLHARCPSLLQRRREEWARRWRGLWWGLWRSLLGTNTSGNWQGCLAESLQGATGGLCYGCAGCGPGPVPLAAASLAQSSERSKRYFLVHCFAVCIHRLIHMKPTRSAPHGSRSLPLRLVCFVT